MVSNRSHRVCVCVCVCVSVCAQSGSNLMSVCLHCLSLKHRKDNQSKLLMKLILKCVVKMSKAE